MAVWEITTLEYDVPLARLFSRRLQETTGEGNVEPLPDGARVRLVGDGATAALAEATSRVLLRDLQYLVIARMTDTVPLPLAEKRVVLRNALFAARSREERAPLCHALTAYFAAENALCLDGYLCFRMQDVLMLWQLCVEQAAQKVLVELEYGAMMQALRLYAAEQQSKMGELRLCIHPDGSCTLSDDDRLLIEYADSSPEGIVTLLVNMAPRRLVILDCSDGAQSRLCEALLEVFAEKAVLVQQ
ncbi:MAG: hypothetical protein IJP98_05255 [Clostridia bacterium]|nr:hypothetical protein [Clostridia bacterium]